MKTYTAKDMREAYLNGWRSRRDGIDWVRACDIASESWPDEEPKQRHFKTHSAGAFSDVGFEDTKGE